MEPERDLTGKRMMARRYPDDFPGVLDEFLESGHETLWLIGRHVSYDGDWDAFFRALDESPADLLATEIHYQSGDRGDANVSDLSALLSLSRLSRRAAALTRSQLPDGAGLETLMPTLVAAAGLIVEEIGGDGPFTPAGRRGKWYGPDTWQSQRNVRYRKGCLHHPVAVARDAPADSSGSAPPPRILYVSPVGSSSGELLVTALATFRAAGCDCLILKYEDWHDSTLDGVATVLDRGHKWPLAHRHLKPESVGDYDFIFFWDDDIDVTGFDPRRFCRIMQDNHLEMAQPAIESGYMLSHVITGRFPDLPPWGDGANCITRRAVGRRTNFVEIMVPVFTRDAWRKFHRYLDPGNTSGWGYDYIPIGRRGIVDDMPVIHTREVRSATPEAGQDLIGFLNSHGFFAYQPVDEGWLFEDVAADPSRRSPMQVEPANAGIPRELSGENGTGMEEPLKAFAREIGPL